ncbi:centrosomal protein of 162 kDa [Pieris brassicae]|uniref:centrosomal protein of 162 kDa n=1 Tax=Pieris brassicae TaxID=7116 RepID=UPI001E662479|nr:centrosomal protein of 162 kDa [Pieris brassicae]
MSSISSSKEMKEMSCDSSNKEFLLLEKTCEALKDSDEEIKMIFNEIKKLSHNNHVEITDEDDVELILRKAENIANETENLLKSSPVVTNKATSYLGDTSAISEVKVDKSKSLEAPKEGNKSFKVSPGVRRNGKDNIDSRRKSKTRPFSAGVVDSKKKEAAKVARLTSGTPKKLNCKHDQQLEELKDTNERVKSLELLNVQLVDDCKALKKKVNELEEDKQVAEFKLVECEKFVNRLAKEYNNRETELKNYKQNEQSALIELNKEKNERKNFSIQREKDAMIIQDLQRQVKEMELILRRKHPDSVSALIVASKSSTVDDNKKKLLEDRILRLEKELKDKETHFHQVLISLQEKFTDMKQKYENHIVDVERQLMDDKKTNNDLKNKINKVNLQDIAVQTVQKSQHTVGTQTFLKADRASSAVSRLTQNSALIFNRLKEDSYLIATIKGLQTELTAKQRTISKINRETEELRKNLRNLQKEKEILMNLNPQKKSTCRPAKSAESVMLKVTHEMEAEISDVRKQKELLMEERVGLLASLKRSNEDLIMLKKKRIQDLHTLQLAHEKELMQMNMQLYPLQEEIKLLNRTVEILQERVRTADDKLIKYQATEMHAGGDNFGSKGNSRK